jgi:ComF family protein
MRLTSRLGQIRSEVKAFIADRVSLSHVRASAAHLLDAVFPPHRLDASDETASPEALMGAGLSASAWSGIRFLDRDGCAMCARPFEGGLFLGSGALCSECTDKPFPFRHTRAACLYDEASKGVILGFKHADRLDMAPMLTRWLERAGADLIVEADIVMPVPLHPFRLIQRRYNQAAELARPVARRLNRTYLGDVLKRTRHTNQVGKGAQARWDSVRGAFRVSARGRKHIAGKSVVLIDDVFTTGATLRACTEALLMAGAVRVDVCVLARAVRH